MLVDVKKYKIRTLSLIYPNNDNYGAYLQEWALCRALNMFSGVEAKCIRYFEFDFYTMRNALSLGECIKNQIRMDLNAGIKIILMKAIKELILKIIVLISKSNAANKKRRLDRFVNFGKTFQDLYSPICWTSEDIASVDADAFLVGSDWVWYIDLRCPRKGYFGYVKTEKPFYSYAASFGINPATEEKHQYVAEMAKNFKNLSVRENEGVETLHRLGFSEAHNDVDPTLLLKPEEWNEAVELPDKTYNLVIYWLPNTDAQEFASYVEEFCAKHPDFSVVVVNPNPLKIPGADYRWDIGPQDFLGYIKTADYVITNSFHACVFCAMFDKPFTVFPRFSGDTRVQNFLQLAGLESRMKKQNEIFKEDNVIDGKTVHSNIERRGAHFTDAVKWLSKC